MIRTTAPIVLLGLARVATAHADATAGTAPSLELIPATDPFKVAEAIIGWVATLAP